MASRNFSRIPQFRPHQHQNIPSHPTFNGVRENFDRAIAGTEVLENRQIDYRCEVECCKDRFREIMRYEYGGKDYELLKSHYYAQLCYWKCQFWLELFRMFKFVFPGWKEAALRQKSYIFQGRTPQTADTGWKFQDVDQGWIDLWRYIYEHLLCRAHLDDHPAIYHCLRSSYPL